MRREYLKKSLALLSAVIVSDRLWAQSQASTTPPQNSGVTFKPYLEVPSVDGEENMVRVFFSPSCPFSKQYFHFFMNLAATLPKSKEFRMSPLVNKLDGPTYILGYLAVQRYYPRYLKNYIEASLIGVQEKGMSPKNWYAIEKIAAAAQIPTRLGPLVQENQSRLKADFSNLVSLQKKLKITNTPSVAVAGTYIVTPEITDGDPQLFSELVNGVISMAM